MKERLNGIHTNGTVVKQETLPQQQSVREVILFQKPNIERHSDNLRRLHGSYYKGTYYHKGVGQPNQKDKNV